MKIFKSIHWILLMIGAIYLGGCAHSHSEDSGHSHEAEDDGHSHGNSDPSAPEDKELNLPNGHHEGLHLTKEQIQTIGLEFGGFSELKINDFVKATGTLGLPSNAYASVNAKISGIITGYKKYVEGNYIKKGEVVAYVDNLELISYQQDYLEGMAQLKLKKLSLERQQKLVNANAGVLKDLETAGAEVEILIAKTKGLKKQLAYLGIPVEDLSPDHIVQRISVISPMSGYISSIGLRSGDYIQPTTSLMEIIADNHLHLELDVFEKDINKLKLGQRISYTIPALGDKVYEGKVSVMGKEFDPNTKTLRIHGHIEGAKPKFIKDLFINAKIWLNDEVVHALPDEAIIKVGSSSFIFVGDDNQDLSETDFDKVLVITGAMDNGYTQVEAVDIIQEGKSIVVKGAYFVYAQSMVGELKHEH